MKYAEQILLKALTKAEVEFLGQSSIDDIVKVIEDYIEEMKVKNLSSNTVLCEVKPTWVENKKCTQCGSENIKWHLSSTKECKDCKSIFRAEELV